MISPLLITFALFAFADAQCQKYVDAASKAAEVLQSKYFTSEGTYGDQAVWIGAVDSFYLSTLDAIAGTSKYADVINTVFKGNEDYLEHGESFDDVQWVSIAYLRAGDVENSKKFYDIATTGKESEYCGGGLFWSGARDYKNAITNELYMTTSGYLYSETKDEKYLNNLKDIWDWFRNSDMQGSNGLYNDGLTKDGTCANNGQTQWTYNQAALLPGLGFLYKSGDDSALTTAYDIIDAIMANLLVDGAAREACESTEENKCNSDQESFKGIMVYFISWFLNIVQVDDGTKYAGFVRSQADKVLENAATGEEGTYGSVWYGKPANPSVTSQSQGSALGALTGAGWLKC